MRRHVTGVFLALIALVVIAIGVVAAYAWEAALAPIAPPDAKGFAADEVRQGEKLAAIGNCSVCHTRTGGKLNAGGRPFDTPFGTIHATNITPDAATGIGNWSFEAFARAMRRGVDREGRHLYPVFPYDHFTLVSEPDNRALYAFLMTRRAVQAAAPANDLPFPLNYRPLIAGWKLLYFREGAHRTDAAKSPEWNRGAYLAEGLGHCGACHTPRGNLGAEKPSEHFNGGTTDGWVAYAINGRSPAPVPWTVESLDFYLRNGWHAEHGISRGPMAPVTRNLGSVDGADVRAIATYVADRMAAAPQAPQLPQMEPPATTAAADAPGKAIFDATCRGCHDGSRPLPLGGIDLRLSTAVQAPDPTNIVNVVLQGLPPAPGERSPVMPGYRSVITDAQIVELLAYMRSAFSDKPAWSDLANLVSRQRGKTRSMAIYSTDGHLAAPARPGEGTTPW